VVDFAAGVYLHFSLENRIFQFRQVGDWIQLAVTPYTLSNTAFGNYLKKVQAKVQFSGDQFATSADMLRVFVVIAMAGYLVWTLVSEWRAVARRQPRHP
jgi:hypothetical protein